MPKTLLLADDSVTIQKVVGISFANEDVVLLTVDNGDDAVVRAREARPDLVLADVMMPGKDGYEVCEALKADPELRHVPVLLLSGTFEPFDEERARRAGADGHITKPFEAQALVDQVNALLARPAPPPAAPSGDATVVVSPGDEEAADSAFDFFEEEMAQTAPAPKVAAALALAPPPTVFAPADDEPLELEAAVEDDEPALRPAPEPFDAGRADDSQPTVLFDDGPPGATRRSSTPPPFLGDGFDPEVLATPAPELPAAPAAPDEPAPVGYEESFDFGFDDGAATATTLAAAVPAATPPPPPSAPPLVEAATELFDDEPEPFGIETAPAPNAAPTPPPFAPVPPPVPPSFEPVPPMPPSMEPAPPPVPASAASEPLAVRVSGPPAAIALSEPIQQQLQQTLEKIVWEAFGDLTERIVRDVIERVEAVAWEVLPQMAETLIREEIRRLKDGDE